MPNLQQTYKQFKQHHTSEPTNSGTDGCKNIVRLHHKDTLGRPLPSGIEVKLYDSTGKVFMGITDSSGMSIHGRGINGSAEIRCGEVFWFLCRKQQRETQIKSDIHRELAEANENFVFDKSDGYVLIKAEEDGTVVTHDNPQFQASHPLKIGAYWQKGSPICNINATYLPPPILLNLRFLQNQTAEDRYQQIEKIKHQIHLDGDVATLFIHGYNVPLGHTGRYPLYEETVNTSYVSKDTPRPPNINIRSDELQHPWLHYGRDDLLKIIQGKGEKLNEKTYKKYDKQFNGEEALSWFPHVEYYLNLAASGKDKLDKFDHWEKYSRIIGVTWSGSVKATLEFFRAELYANEAGRELAKVLKQLIDNKIKINILTHSLGARVALSALNILGDFDGEYDEKIDNLIMWEPAVADNAFTNHYTDKFNPIAMEIFPYAHKAAKQITVLYSTEDGVVAGDTYWGDREKAGLFGGAYPKKYSRLSTALTGGTTPLGDYYINANQAKITIRMFDNSATFGFNKLTTKPADAYQQAFTREISDEYIRIEKLKDKHRCQDISDSRQREFVCDNIQQNALNKTRIRQAIEAEAEKLSASGGISNEIYYLRPWSCFRRFKKDDPIQKALLEHIIEILSYTIVHDWQQIGMDIRPPLGARGDLYSVQGKNTKRDLSREDKELYFDGFITDMEDKKKIIFFPQIIIDEKGKQAPYFITHSAMREWEYEWEGMRDRNKVFPLIYEKSYKEWIIERINTNSKFGRY
ncbi:alpha/beta hydrolase [Rodentibacter pneumotropicus]|uniref:Alpha/beta hydrolase n=1 Tax=Rodentibacter pneumotropicus TaxID=758 RepID=A0A4S2QFA0_9PAST|nr:alpha/beta hydrolase [Rodentibacter pneumotropicus]THA00867.1 alpha/beta hydrolase [Rodentibacter pneumotropicus]THA09029.1 alpha/beta hydrolase [Rodentibacter pneumotropicus]THA14837.1 alpha/beta hydrolase [Rodentibacter pneumotropicus]